MALSLHMSEKISSGKTPNKQTNKQTNKTLHGNRTFASLFSKIFFSIVESGVVGSCGALCSLLEQKTGSQALGAVCNILCDIVGIEEFIKLVQE